MLRHGSFSFLRNFFFFSTPTLYQIGEALKKENFLARVYVRAYRRIIYFLFIFLLFFSGVLGQEPCT